MDAKLIERIRARAYDLWVADGCHQGQDMANWLRAEAEVLEEIAVAKKPTRRAPAKKAPAKKPALKKQTTRKTSAANT